MADLSDYAQALGAAQALVPNFDAGDQRRVALQGQQIQNQIGTQQVAANQQAMAAQQVAQARAQQFHSDLTGLGANPTPAKLYQLSAQYPEFADHLNASIKGLGEAQSAATLNDQAQLYAATGDKSTYGAAQALVQRHIDAAKTAGQQPDPMDTDLLDALQKGDETRIKGYRGLSYATVNALKPDAAKNFTTDGGEKTHVITQGGALVDDTGKELYRASPNPVDSLQVPIFDKTGKRIATQLVSNGGRGGDPSSVDGAASGSAASSSRGDVSRLINSDAGGGQVPSNVQTLGQFVNFGKALNRKGAKSSSAGTYQINGSTMAEFGPQALGANWQAAPFNADTQDKVGEAIFNWAKTQPNPAAALRGRWVSLTPGKAAQLVQGDWTQARDTIAQGETGGGAGASASRGAGGVPTAGGAAPGYFGPSGGGSADDNLIGPAYLATLPAGRKQIVQNVLDGKMAAPKPGSRFGEALAEDIARVDPSFDPSVQPMRMKARQDFSGNGKMGQVFAAYNRFAAHLNSAYDLHLKLSGGYNGPGGDTAATVGQSFQKGLVNQYNTELEGLQGEFQKLTKLGVANEGEANRLIAAAHAGQAGVGRAGALKGMATLVVGGYAPAVQQWKSAFPNQPLPVDVTAGAKAAINNVIHDGTSAVPVGRNGAPAAAAHFTHMSASGAYGFIPGQGWVKAR